MVTIGRSVRSRSGSRGFAAAAAAAASTSGGKDGTDLELGLDLLDPGAQGVGGDALRRLGALESRSDADHATAPHGPTLVCVAC